MQPKHIVNSTVFYLASLLLPIALFVSCDKPQLDNAGSMNGRPVEAKPFKGEVYHAFDSQNAITLVSRDELELREGNTNLICKYTKQDDALRVVANVMGTTQAIYYRVTSEGLQDNQGHMFYNAVGLEGARLAAQMARHNEAEQARKQEEENRRIAVLSETAKHSTRTIATLPAKDYSTDDARKTVITDVDVLIPGKYTNNDPITLWYAGISYISFYPNSRQPYCSIMYNNMGNSVYFSDRNAADKFVSTLDTAIKAFNIKYRGIPGENYQGITDK